MRSRAHNRCHPWGSNSCSITHTCRQGARLLKICVQTLYPRIWENSALKISPWTDVAEPWLRYFVMLCRLLGSGLLRATSTGHDDVNTNVQYLLPTPKTKQKFPWTVDNWSLCCCRCHIDVVLLSIAAKADPIRGNQAIYQRGYSNWVQEQRTGPTYFGQSVTVAQSNLQSLRYSCRRTPTTPLRSSKARLAVQQTLKLPCVKFHPLLYQPSDNLQCKIGSWFTVTQIGFDLPCGTRDDYMDCTQ